MKIALISCSKSKLGYRCEAKKLYSASKLFTLSYQYAGYFADKIYILSAKHGLVKDSQVLDPYNFTLNNLPKNRQKDWANYVLSQMGKEFDLENDEFMILAGQNYYQNLAPRLRHWELPLDHMRYGERISFLQQQLQILQSRIPDSKNNPANPANNQITARLHQMFAAMPRYSWQDIDKIPFNNGIYIMFEKGNP